MCESGSLDLGQYREQLRNTTLVVGRGKKVVATLCAWTQVIDGDMVILYETTG